MHHLNWKACLNFKIWSAAPLALVILSAPVASSAGPALAMAPHSLDAGRSLVVPVMDQEDLSVEEDLVPDEVPDSEREAAGQDVPMPEQKSGGDGDIEDQTIKRLEPSEE